MEAVLVESKPVATASPLATLVTAATPAAPAAPVKPEVSVTTHAVDPASPVFAGHFPGHPILPGVMLIGLARQAAAQALGRPLRLVRIVRLRFVKPVLPGMALTLEHELAAPNGEDGARRLVVRWKQADGAVCARGELHVG